MKKYPYHDFIDKLKQVYSKQPFPDDAEYRACVRSIEYESFASPAVEFCEYVYTRKLNWFDCSWEYDILPLEEDTTILPYYIFSTPFLRYYFPMCLNISIRYFFGAYYWRNEHIGSEENVGNIDAFVIYTLKSIIKHADQLELKEKELISELSLLIRDNNFYNYEEEYLVLCNALKTNS